MSAPTPSTTPGPTPSSSGEGARTILVTGATGYVGSRLVPMLLDAGHTVRAAFRDLSETERFPWCDEADCVELDVFDAEEVGKAVDGADAVYYLVHGLGGDDFREKDREGAQTMADAAAKAGVERIIYLSGIVPDVPREELSEHILSRLEVEETLGSTGVPVTSLRAAVLVGGASTSFEIIRQISERLPVHTVPSWMDSTVQPIATVDVLAALVGALDGSPRDRSYDVGGPDALPYSELLELYTDVAGLDRSQITIPFLPEKLVGTMAGVLTDVPTGTVESLVESLEHDMVCGDDDFRADLVPGRPLMGLREAFERSLAAPGEDVDEGDPMVVHPSDPPWARRDGGSDEHPEAPSAMDRVKQAASDLNPFSKG